MADVEQRAEAEAAKKGLSGGARKSYIGGVFNRIRQAHERATTPGKGAAHLNRKKRVETREEHDRRIAAEIDEQQKRDAPFWAAVRKNEQDNAAMIHRDAELTAQIQRDEQRRGINRGMARRREKANEAGTSIGGQRKPAKPPKREPAERQRQRAIADAIKHGAPDFPPGTLVAAQGKSKTHLSVRPYNYHGNPGYLISGHDALGRNISIFARSKSEAERMRDDIKAGRETQFDSERRSGGDGA